MEDHLNFVEQNYKIITYKFRFAVFQCNFWKFIMDTVREIHTAQKLIMHCDVISMIFAYYSKLDLSRKKQNNELL